MIQTLLEVAIIVFAYPYFYKSAMNMSFETKLIVLISAIVVVHVVVSGLFWLLGYGTSQLGGGMGIQTAIGNQKVMQTAGTPNIETSEQPHELDDLDANTTVHAAPANEVNIISRFMDDRMALNQDNKYASSVHENSTDHILNEQVPEIEGYTNNNDAAML